MSRRPKADLPSNLFPMLAVLVSMMGALILLLLGVTRQAQRTRDLERRIAEAGRRAQVARSVQSSLRLLPSLPAKWIAPPLPELPPPVERLDAPPELPAIPDLVDRLHPLRDQQHRLEVEIAELRQIVERKRGAIAALRHTEIRPKIDNGNSPQRQLEDLRTEQQVAAATLARLKRQILELQTEKRKLLAELNHVENQYAILPYTGSRGTKRRPIYFECREDGVVLQPEGIKIGIGERRGSAPPVVLAAVVAAVVDAFGSSTPDERPYPLAIVRPDGILTHYAARRVFDGMRQDSGYEVVASEVKLDFGKPNPAVRAAVERVLASFPRGPLAGTSRGTAQPGSGGNATALGIPGAIGQAPVSQGQSATLGYPQEIGQFAAASSDPIQGESTTLQPDGGGTTGALGTELAIEEPGEIAGAAGGEESDAEDDWDILAPRSPLGRRRVERTIFAVCAKGTFNRGPSTRSIGVAPSKRPAQLGAELRAELAKAVKSWGEAGRMAEWAPRVVLMVEPGGIDAYYRVRSALYGTALKVERIDLEAATPNVQWQGLRLASETTRRAPR